jgi:formate/nitrite transporter FocA (FNT family)
LWFTYSFKDATATILGCFFGILVFGISGFQHVVANSFPLFAAMFLMPQGDIHPQAYLYFVSDNLIPAGIGNWIAGALILPFATNVLFKQQGNALSVKLKLQELKAQIEKKV